MLTHRKCVPPKREDVRKDSPETCFCGILNVCLSHQLRRPNPYVLAQMLEYERCSEIFQSSWASSGVIQRHSLGHLVFFMFDVVSCGEAAQGSLYFTAFHSKKGGHAEKCVHHLVDKRADPLLIPAQAGGGSCDGHLPREKLQGHQLW